MKVSFDLHVYISSTDFPERDFLSLAAELGETSECERDHCGRRFRSIIDESAVFFAVNELAPESFGFAQGFKWRIGVYANSGCSPRARWAQFAVLFRSLTLIRDSVPYDPQSDRFFDDADEFVEFSRNRFPRWPKLVAQLRRLELLTDEGQPRF